MLGAGVFIVVVAVVVLIVKSERDLTNDSPMAELRKMNRGKMDQPGWTKKPWQHESSDSRQ
jgi:hypothetical protein